MVSADVPEERIAVAFLNDVVRGDGAHKDDKCAHCWNVLEEIDEDGVAVRGGAVQHPRQGAP